MKLNPRLEDHRLLEGAFWSLPGEKDGAFKIPGPTGRVLMVIASAGTDKREPKTLLGWEHVSVSTARNVPNWSEMDFVKRLFWDDEECVVQYHPPRSLWVNNQPNVLHLWRWTGGGFPMPHPLLVGLKDAGIIDTPEKSRHMQLMIEEQVEQIKRDEPQE